MITHDDLRRFYDFAEEKISTGEANSLEDLVVLWKTAHPSADQDLTAVQRGVADADAGRTNPVKQAFDEVRDTILGQQ